MAKISRQIIFCPFAPLSLFFAAIIILYYRIMKFLGGHIIVTLLFLSLLTSGCSIRSMVINSAADALSASGTAFAADDDPELIRDATAFSLKTVEILLDERPEHTGLLLTAAKGFTQYSYGFVQQDADFVEEEDFDEALRLRKRAAKLYSRSIAYSRRALEVYHDGFLEAFDENADSAVTILDKNDVALMYWYAAALGLKIGLSKDDPMEIAKLPQVGTLIDRALELDPGWDNGALYEFMVSYEGGLPESMGGSAEKAEEYLKKAIELSHGERAGPYVAYAETVCVMRQDKEAFIENLNKALAVSVAEPSPDRLANIINQNRAEWLLKTVDDLFF